MKLGGACLVSVDFVNSHQLVIFAIPFNWGMRGSSAVVFHITEGDLEKQGPVSEARLDW